MSVFENCDVDELTTSGVIPFEGMETPVNMHKAFSLWSQAAKKGNEGTKLNLGVLFYDGIAVSQDIKKAERLWVGAIEKGYAGAYINLGVMYYEGKGVVKNEKKAKRMWKTAPPIPQPPFCSGKRQVSWCVGCQSGQPLWYDQVTLDA